MIEVHTIKLERKLSEVDLFEPKRVNSKLIITFSKDYKFKMYRIPVLEHKDYIFRDGLYKMVYEYSPKFKRNLWELKGIEGRTEIKIHAGRNYTQSRGCPLVRNSDLILIHNTLDNSKDYHIYIQTL